LDFGAEHLERGLSDATKTSLGIMMMPPNRESQPPVFHLFLRFAFIGDTGFPVPVKMSG